MTVESFTSRMKDLCQKRNV